MLYQYISQLRTRIAVRKDTNQVSKQSSPSDVHAQVRGCCDDSAGLRLAETNSHCETIFHNDGSGRIAYRAQGRLESGGALTRKVQYVEILQPGVTIDLENREPCNENDTIQNEHEARALVVYVLGADK